MKPLHIFLGFLGLIVVVANEALPSIKGVVSNHHSYQPDTLDTLSNPFNDYKVKLDAEYQAFKARLNAEYQDYLTARRREFEEYLTAPEYNIVIEDSTGIMSIDARNGDFLYEPNKPSINDDTNVKEQISGLIMRNNDEIAPGLEAAPEVSIETDNLKDIVGRVKGIIKSDYTSRRALTYLPEIKRVAKEQGIELPLALAIGHVESRFNPGAKSHANAIGIFQVLLPTGRQALDNPRLSEKQLFDVNTNVEAGIRHLSYLYERWKGVKNLASREYIIIASYNAGSGRLSNVLTRGKSKSVAEATRIANQFSSTQLYNLLSTSRRMPVETKKYLALVLQNKIKYKHIHDWELSK